MIASRSCRDTLAAPRSGRSPATPEAARPTGAPARRRQGLFLGVNPGSGEFRDPGGRRAGIGRGCADDDEFGDTRRTECGEVLRDAVAQRDGDRELVKSATVAGALVGENGDARRDVGRRDVEAVPAIGERDRAAQGSVAVAARHDREAGRRAAASG